MRKGIGEAAVHAIGSGQQPAFTLADEQAVYDFSVQSLVDKQVSAATWLVMPLPAF
ncbi:MAG: hypothetical protein QE279_10390 [Rhodoferax sp.]|nr:hypothetical protein [Rhodoferax sp.]